MKRGPWDPWMNCHHLLIFCILLSETIIKISWCWYQKKSCTCYYLTCSDAVEMFRKVTYFPLLHVFECNRCNYCFLVNGSHYNNAKKFSKTTRQLDIHCTINKNIYRMHNYYHRHNLTEITQLQPRFTINLLHYTSTCLATLVIIKYMYSKIIFHSNRTDTS